MKNGLLIEHRQTLNRPFLMSERVSLVPMDPSTDAEYVCRWFNDPEVTYFMFYGQLPLNLERTRKLLELQNDGKENLVFMIVLKDGGLKIGLTGLYDIDWISRRSEFRILIGNKSIWGKGYGAEVTELLTWFGFDRLNMNRIDLGVTSLNKNAIKTYQNAGYEHEFTRKDYMYRNSRYYDANFMVIFHSTYEKKFSAKHAKRFGLQNK